MRVSDMPVPKHHIILTPMITIMGTVMIAAIAMDTAMGMEALSGIQTPTPTYCPTTLLWARLVDTENHLILCFQ
jgi:hypothetical protein